MAGDPFDPDAYLAEGAAPFDPDAFLAEPASPAPLLDSDGIELATLEPTEDSRWRATQRAKLAEDEAAAAKRSENNDFIRLGFETSLKAPDEEGSIQKLATHFGVPTSAAAAYKADLDIAYKASKFDPETFQKDNPELARMLLRDRETNKTIFRDVKLPSLVQAFRFVQDKLQDYRGFVQETLGGRPGALAEAAGLATNDTAELQRQAAIGPEAVAAEREARDAPKKTAFIDNPAAAYIRENAPHLAPFGELSQNWEGLAIAELNSQIANRVLLGQEGTMLGQSVADLERQVVDRKRLNRRLDLGEAGTFTDILTGSASTAYVMTPAKTGRGSIDFGLGILAAPAAGFVASKPGGKALVGAIIATSAFQLEQGSVMDESAEWRTDAGQSLTKRERAAAATVYAAGATAIELGEFGILAGLGKSAGAFKLAGGKAAFREAFTALTLRSPEFRGLLLRAGAALVGEPAEEGTQALFQSAVTYFAKSLKQGELQARGIGQAEVEDALEQAGAVMPFSVAQTAMAAGIGRLTAALDRDQNLTGNGQAEAIAALKESPTIQAAPAAVARLIEDTTAKTGNPVTHMYVDAEVLGTTALFQSANAEEGQKESIDELLGPGGAKKLEDAIAIGGKVEIPMPLYLEKWAGTPTAAALAEHTTTRAAHLTPAQLAADPTLIDQQTRLVVEEADRVAAQQAEAETLFTQLETEVASAVVNVNGKKKPIGKNGAKKLANLFRAAYRTTAAAYGHEAAAQHLAEGRVQMAKGEGLSGSLLQGGTPSTPLDERAAIEDPEQRATDINIDPETGLRNFDAWNAEPRQKGKPVAAVTLLIKPVNDHPKGGHDTANAFLAKVAPIVHAADTEAARKGPTFLFHGDEAALEGVLAAARAQLPEGFDIVGQVGAETTATLDALDRQVTAGRESGALPKERSETKVDLTKLPEFEAGLGPRTLVKPNLSERMLRDAGAMKTEKMRAVYRDKGVQGLLSAQGWHHTPRKPFVASLDLRGLGKENREKSQEAGNQILQHFGEVAVKVGAESVDMARTGGDEYALQANTEAELEDFLDRLDAQLRRSRAHVKFAGRTYLVDVRFRDGIGESYGLADRELNERKSRESGGDQPRAAGRADREAARREARVSRDRARGEAAARAGDGGDAGLGTGAGDAADVVDEVVDRGPTHYEQDPRTPEEIAAQEAQFDRMTNKTKQAWARKEFEYILAGRAGKAPGNGGLSDAQRNHIVQQLAKNGFVDPDLQLDLRTGTFKFPRLKTKSAKAAAKKGKGKKTTTMKERLAFKNQISGKDSGGSGDLHQSSEDEKNLLVQHNLDASNLEHAEELGGFAAPSLAVSRKEHPLKGFGEITLIGKPDLADPKQGTPVFGSDVYSPRHPSTGNKVDPKKFRDLAAFLEPYAKRTGGYIADLDEELQNRGPREVVGRRSSRVAFELAWLETVKDIKLQVPTKPAKMAHFASDQPSMIAFFKEHGVDPTFKPEGEYHRALSAAFKKAAHEYATAARTDDEKAEDLAETLLLDYGVGADGLISIGRTSRLMGDAKRVGTTEIDKDALEQATEEAVEKAGRADFEKWAEAKAKEAISGKFISKTSESGNTRRIPYTLENILREVTRKVRQGEDFHYGLGTARAAGSRRFKNLDQIKAARDTVVSKEAFEKVKKPMDDRFFKLVDQLRHFSPDPNRFGIAETVAVVIGEAYKRGNTIRGELEKDQFKGVPTDLVHQLEDFAADLLAMPTEYFEAKPQRIVRLKEFEVAVVPDNASPETLAILKKNGITVETYKNGDETDRDRAVTEAAAKAEALFAGDPKNPRGSVRHVQQGMRDVFLIAMNPNADLSTFLHESGHVFLELLTDLAQRPDATAQAKADFAAVLKWFGIEDPASVKRNAQGWSFTRKQHEKWADGFLVYLREGKAPSAELKASFKRFSDWLKAIYKTVAQLGVEVSPEIRGVFDRLLATDEEIDAMRRQMGKPLFGSLAEALAAGLSPEKYAEWLEDQALANSSAERAAKLRIRKEELRKKDKQWKADLAAEVTAAEAEYEELPARQASIIILHETRVASLGGFDPGAHSGTRLTLNRAQVEAVVGVAAARRFRLSQDGQDIDVVADTLSGLGFATGADMLKAIEVLPPKDVWAKKLAEHRMAEKNPGLLEDREKLRELVGKGLHGDETERSLLKEIEALTAKAPNGSRPVESIALAAKQMVERTPVGKLNASDALRAERRAANMAVRELAKGNFGEVLTQKHRQLLSMYLYRELQAAREEREKFLELTKDLASDKSRAKLGKANPVLRDGVDYLLEKFGLKGVGQTPTAVDLTAVVRVLEDSDASKVDLPALQEIIAKLGMGDWKSLTMAKLRVVEQALRNIQGVARYMNTVILDEKRADKADVVEQTLAAIDKEMVKRPAGYGQMASSNTLLENAGGLYNSITGSLLRPNTMLQDLAGGDVDSIIQRAFIDPLRKAKHVEADLNAEVAAPIIEAFEAIPKSVRATFRDEIDGARLFPDHTDKAQPPRYRYQLLMMALNAGNEGNLQRLLGGAILNPDGSRTVLGRNITPTQLKTALDLLTKEEIAWVQSIFDAHEAPRQLRGETEAKSLKERAFDLEERDTGLRPEAVVAKPLVLKNGALRGGYFPAVYDRSAEPAGERQAAQTLAELFDPTYTRPGTSTGHLKARVPSFIGVISLEPGTIYSHLGKQVHDLAFRDVVKSVGSLVLDQQIDQALKRYLGDGKARQFLKWMKDIGSSNGMLDNSMQGLEKVTQFVRGNMGPAILGWKLTTALGDIGNLGTAVAATPLKTKYLAVGVSTFLTGRSQAVDFAREMSGELRFQKDTLQRDFARNVKDLTSRWRNMKLLGPLAWWKDHSFAFMEMSQLATAVPVWIGSYRQALDEGRAHDEAVRFADNILNQVFPSHSAVDQSGILRDKKFWGLSTMFYGYMNTAYNLQHQIARPLFNREFAEAGAGKRAATVAKVSGSMLALYLSVGALSELFSGRGPEDGDDDDEPSDDPLLRNLARKRNWVVRKTIMAPLTLLPPMGQRGLEAWAVGKRQQGGSGTLVEAYATSIGEGVVGVFKGATDTEKQVVATTRALGLLMGVGTAPIGTTGKYVFDALNGAEPQSPADVASGLLYGRRDNQPENPITFITGQ